MSPQDDSTRDSIQSYAERWTAESPFLGEAAEEQAPVIHPWYQAYTPFREEQELEERYGPEAEEEDHAAELEDEEAYEPIDEAFELYPEPLAGEEFVSANAMPTIDIARAVERNRRWGRELGWQSRRAEIAAALGLEPGASDAAFARAVAAYQARQRLEVDGTIGPDTWKRLKAELVSARPSARLPGTYTLSTDEARSVLADVRVRERVGDSRHRIVYADEQYIKLEEPEGATERRVQVGVFDYDRNITWVADAEPSTGKVLALESQRGGQSPLTAEELDEARSIVLSSPGFAHLRSARELSVGSMPARVANERGSPYHHHRVFTLTFWSGGRKLAEAVVDLSSRRLLPPEAGDEAVERRLARPAVA